MRLKFQAHTGMYVFIRPGWRRTEDIYSFYQTGAKKLRYRSPVKRASPGKRACFGVAHTTMAGAKTLGREDTKTNDQYHCVLYYNNSLQHSGLVLRIF